MKELHSFAELAVALTVGTVRAVAAAEHGLGRAAALIAADAKQRIGEYQSEAGPFPAWAQLADSTEASKARMGYPPNAPLLATGDLRNSIQSEAAGSEAVAGSKSAIAAFQELGTSTIPPRPFMGPAAFENRDKIAAIIRNAAGMALSGESLTYGGGNTFARLTS